MTVTKVYANMLSLLNANRMDGERLRRIVEAEDVGSALKMLGDYGYTIADDIDGFVIAETNLLIEFVWEYAASAAVRDALLAPFVYNNAKLAYKSRFVEIPADAYYKTNTDPALIAAADYSECDKYLAEALTALDVAGEKRPQAIDIEITRAMYRYVMSCKEHNVRKYFRAEIDLKNILTAARMKRLRIDRDEFIDGGTLKPSVLKEAIAGDDFAEYVGKPYTELAEAMEASEFAELGKFERESDDYLFFLTDSAVKSMASFKPFVNYYARVLIELKAIKTALVCVKTDSRDTFYSRMPKIYDA